MNIIVQCPECGHAELRLRDTRKVKAVQVNEAESLERFFG